MAYENFYQGTSYPFDTGSDSLFTGAQLNQSQLGASTGVQSANQITEVSNFFNQGMKTAEVSTINQEVFDMIPEQHFKEINRLTKLTNTDVTLHAPIIEPSGFTQQGWSEMNREAAEKQFADTLIRGKKLSPDKPMPITVHASSQIPATETMPVSAFKESEITPMDKAYMEATGVKEIPTQMVAANQETGQLRPLTRKEMMSPRRGAEKQMQTPMESLHSLNATEWSHQLSQLALNKKQADELARQAMPVFQAIAEKQQKGEALTEQDQAMAMQAKADMSKSKMFLEDVELSFRSAYEQAAKYGNNETKKVLGKISEQWQKLGKKNAPSELLDNSLIALQEVTDATGAPQMYVPVEEFAIDKSSETFANAAFTAYKKLGDKAPIVSIENPPYGGAFGNARDLKNLIEESRAKLAKKIEKDKGLKAEAAKQIASTMIGATWDTSHNSMMRAKGFEKNELVKQAEIIAPYVKHVHLNDNFGFSHTDLPPGMGDVPFDKIMEKLKKKGYKGKAIFEGGNFFQHFKTAPHGMVLEAMGSPMYSSVAGPTWSQTYGTMGAYSGGYGPFLPQQHFSTYGSGFSGLPQELGGQVGGGQSRMSGTPMS